VGGPDEENIAVGRGREERNKVDNLIATMDTWCEGCPAENLVLAIAAIVRCV
jgi:hypothetical protein